MIVFMAIQRQGIHISSYPTPSHVPCFFSNRSPVFGWCVVVQLAEDMPQDPVWWTWSEDSVLVSESIVECFRSVCPSEESVLCSSSSSAAA